MKLMNWTECLSHSRAGRSLRVLVLFSSCATGCLPPEQGEGEVGEQLAALEVENGLITNGMAASGLTTNGLATNGLNATGLLSPLFSIWFNSNATNFSDMVMQYVVTCALGSGQSLTWTNLVGLPTTYTWYGVLGLAPGWASGSAATEAEQQLISACMAAHVNKFNVQITVSMQGSNGQGGLIAVQSGEFDKYSQREACFFGNLFLGEGVFIGNDGLSLSVYQSSARVCGLSPQDRPSADCSPMVHVGSCASLCTAHSSDPRYTVCTYNSKEYLPMTTRIRTADIYTCGDGVCQVSESCGAGNTFDSCYADCGTCP